VAAGEIGASDLKAARARRTEAKSNLAYTKVEAPGSGVASRSLRSEGSLVEGPQTLLTTVMQVDPIWVNFGIPDNEQADLGREVQAGRLALPQNGHVGSALKRAHGPVDERARKPNLFDGGAPAPPRPRHAR